MIHYRDAGLRGLAAGRTKGRTRCWPGTASTCSPLPSMGRYQQLPLGIDLRYFATGIRGSPRYSLLIVRMPDRGAGVCVREPQAAGPLQRVAHGLLGRVSNPHPSFDLSFAIGDFHKPFRRFRFLLRWQSSPYPRLNANAQVPGGVLAAAAAGRAGADRRQLRQHAGARGLRRLLHPPRRARGSGIDRCVPACACRRPLD